MSETAIHLLVEKVEKERFAWTPEKIKMLKNYVRKKFNAEDISNLLEFPVAHVVEQTEKIMNSNKKPILGSNLYEEKTLQKHAVYIPPFVTATISIDENDKPIKQCKESDAAYSLYAGECSCEKPSSHQANFLILGPSGAGKTTFVDSLTNFLLGIEIQDKFRYKLVDEKQIIEQRNAVMEAEGKQVSSGSA